MSERTSAISIYLSEIKKNVADGNATEHTHRPALKALLEKVDKGITATNEPRRILCGSPDFQITRKGVPLGHVETKDIGTNLDEMQRGKGPHGEQFIRYRDGLPNWILTDYLQFRWFVNGEKRLTVCVAELDAKGKLKLLPDGEEKLGQLLTAFLKQEALTIGTARDLARRMAGMTRIIRDLIINTFDHEKEQGLLHNWLAAFRETLIPDLNEKQFADMFAQTLAYGLFAAWINTPLNKVFSREMAAYNLPKTNPFLRKLFAEIAGVDMPDSIAWAVDDIVQLLKHADMSGILKDFGKGLGKEDPVVHFYETFLAAYDPKMREVRGVYYTPEPVVSYIVRSIDHLLKTRFNRPKGLADENTLILDPATGTATFLYFVIDLIHQKFAKQAGAWDDYVAKHLLNRIFGFELLMAPYAIAHLKIGMQLQDTGYQFDSDTRLGIYLTNTLEEAAKRSEQLFADWIAKEANEAGEIKRDKEIMVVLGNPPYSVASQNRGRWIQTLLEDYKRNLSEKKLNLDDDFIKFIRFAQWRIERTGYGVLGFITNNTYLDGLTHRRIRECLLRTFNEIHVFNLHGDSRKKETTPDGGVDKNVFDIQQGVVIILAVKQPANNKRARVFHADIWGTRQQKYDVLLETDISKTDWNELDPQLPNYFFVPRKDAPAEEELSNGWSIRDVFSVWGSGFNTDRDALCLDFEKKILAERMRKFFSGNYDEKFRDEFDVHASSSYDPEKRAKEVMFDEKHVHPVVYRPFDVRFVYYHQGFTSRPVFEVQGNMLHDNLALVSARQSKEPFGVLVIHSICTHKIVTVYDRSSLFPLFLYPTSEGELALHSNRWPNLSPVFLKALAEKLKLPQDGPYGLPKGITPEDIFHYAYAVFHSPTYRTRYVEFLKIDFPRLPLTSDVNLFRSLAAKGAELVALHLMQSPRLEEFITDWPVKGDNVVEKVQYTEKNKRVWINKTQYFGGVPKAVWEFHIGGYQVCDKWLKDRKRRALSYDDIMHYQKVIVALRETLRLMTEIDECIPHWPLA
jgi:predicted helicase